MIKGRSYNCHTMLCAGHNDIMLHAGTLMNSSIMWWGCPFIGKDATRKWQSWDGRALCECRAPFLLAHGGPMVFCCPTFLSEKHNWVVPGVPASLSTQGLPMWVITDD